MNRFPSAPAPDPRTLMDRVASYENAGDARARQEALYRLVADLAQDFIFIVRADFTVEFANPCCGAAFRCRPEELVGKNLNDLFPSGELERMKANITRVVESGDMLTVEEAFTRFPSENRWQNSRLIPVHRDGRVWGVLGISRDITPFREAELTLQQSERRYRTLFERNVAGVFRCDLAGRVLLANEALHQMAGLPDGVPLPGRNLFDMIRDPAERDRLMAKLTAQGQLTGEEVATVRADGTPAWKLVNAHLIDDDTGQGPCIEGTLIDITERKRVHDSLQSDFQRQRKAMEGIIQAMALTIELRDPHTAGHEQRVSQLAAAIAETMEMPEVTVEAIRMTAIIHDIGKIYVPAEILSKPGRLSELEYRLIQMHPQVSFDILKVIDFPWPVAAIVLQHHERLDGSGYPQGLTAEHIRPEARVLAVADVVEAMTSHRPYRPAPGLEAALDEISEFRGRRYDAAAVDAALSLFRERHFTFR
jgi:PAS domain S-box-containing protein/putative nucleotidyltransferase with HDIG domain